jgi:hypothetical protein
MPNCPLAVEGTTAYVSSTGTGFTVNIRAKDAKSAQEVLRRAQALTASTPSAA